MKYYYQVFIGTHCFASFEPLTKKEAFAQIEEKLGCPLSFRKGAFNKKPLITDTHGRPVTKRLNSPDHWICEFSQHKQPTGRWWEIRLLGGSNAA